MKTSLDCIPCLLRQALDSARMFSKDPAVHERILRDVLAWSKDMDMNQPAPVMGRRIYRRLRELTGVKDPYRAAKAAQNKLALRLLSELRAGLDKLVKVLDNGSDMGGTALEETSAVFNALFNGADLVIAKGQGNYETLSEASRPVYFLFKAKCAVIAARAGVPPGAQVLVPGGKGGWKLESQK